MKFLNLISRSTTEETDRLASRPSFVFRLATASALLFGLFSTACGNTLYLVQINQAEESFQEAKELGAEQYAPYEYYGAKVRIREAQRQAAQAEYGAASDLSHEANELANQAILKSKTARRAVVVPRGTK